MAVRAEAIFTPPGAEDFGRYIRPSTTPPLDLNALSLGLVFGEERKRLRTITDGDWSLVLRYREREAYITSCAEKIQGGKSFLEVRQFQGSKEGYRVVTGMHVVAFLSDQIRAIAEHPKAPYYCIVMPPPTLIPGVIDAKEGAIGRYETAKARLGLNYSQEQNLFVRNLR